MAKLKVYEVDAIVSAIEEKIIVSRRKNPDARKDKKVEDKFVNQLNDLHKKKDDIDKKLNDIETDIANIEEEFNEHLRETGRYVELNDYHTPHRGVKLSNISDGMTHSESQKNQQADTPS